MVVVERDEFVMIITPRSKPATDHAVAHCAPGFAHVFASTLATVSLASASDLAVAISRVASPSHWPMIALMSASVVTPCISASFAKMSRAGDGIFVVTPTIFSDVISSLIYNLVAITPITTGLLHNRPVVPNTPGPHWGSPAHLWLSLIGGHRTLGTAQATRLGHAHTNDISRRG